MVSVPDIVREFARLTTIGYTAPWNDPTLTEAQQQAAALAMASEWAEILRPATAEQVALAVRAWAGADAAGHWPKPGAVRARIAWAPAVAQIDTSADLDGDLEIVARASEYASVRAALWQGDPPEARWPEGSMARAARRLLGARMLLERLAPEHPVPESSHAQILVDAVIHGALYEPATTLDDVRAYLVRRIAEDPERIAHYERLRVEAERRLSAPEVPPVRTGPPVGSKLWARAQKLGEA